MSVCDWEPFSLDQRCQTARALALAPHEIHVWRIDSPSTLDPGSAGCDRIATLERRAQARAHARRRTLQILAAYAIDAQVSHDPSGRPTINAHDIQVSASYAQAIALFALARQAVGIDVELQREVVAADVIARSYFAAAEYARWRAERTPATHFLQYWTRKEAYLKAVGRGFEHPPQAVDASCDSIAGLIFNALDGFESLRWAVRSFQPDRGHTAAIAHARAPDMSYRWLAPLAMQ